LLERFLERTEFSSYQDFYDNYKLNYPENFNFGFDVVDAWAALEPGKTALVWCNDSGEERFFTFEDIKRGSACVANMLTEMGVKKGDNILLILKQRYEYWLTAVALHKIGAIVIPCSVQLTAKDLVYRNNAARIKMIISVNEPYTVAQVESARLDSPSVAAYGLIGAEREGWFNFSEYSAYPDVFDRPAGDKAVYARDMMLTYFTSGTTGMPKMVAHDNTYPLGHITTAKYWQRVQNNGLHLTVSDSGWAKFGWGKIYGQWIAGSGIMAYDMDRFVPAKLLNVVERYKVTTFCAPPTMYRYFIKEDLSRFDLSSIKHASTAGEPLNPEVFNQFLKSTGLKIHDGFGQSESSVIMATFQWFGPRPGSMGKPSPLYDIDLIDKDGRSCPVGEDGEVIVRNLDKRFPEGLLKGYFQNGRVNTDCFKGGIYRTGDVAWRDVNGYYWFVGRTDDVIKCSGYRIGPFEVESAVMEHPAVLECAITAYPDEIRGQVVKATVVLAQGYEPSDALIKEIQNHVKKTTAPYKYPRRVEFVSELPKTLGGKIKRAQIKRESEESAGLKNRDPSD
jgi:acetyl-CoA synthetase